MALHFGELTEFRAMVVDHGTTRTISLGGEIDIASAGAFNRALAAALWEADFETVVLDFAEVTFIDSTGIRILLDAYATGVEDGIRLVLLPGPPAVQRLFEICGLTKALPFAPTRMST